MEIVDEYRYNFHPSIRIFEKRMEKRKNMLPFIAKNYISIHHGNELNEPLAMRRR